MRFSCQNLRRLAIQALLAAITGASASAQTPILNPSNGHYYQKVNTTGLTWTAAKAAASSMSHQGMAGHLATITDAQESQWLEANLPPGGNNYWLGGLQDLNSPLYSEPSGGWTWVTGEPWVYTNWATPGEPNNCCGGEHYLDLRSDYLWNDNYESNSGLQGFIVEFDFGLAGPYCTAGTTTNGCVPAIQVSAQPSVTFANPCSITVTSVEGQRSGLVFYGIGNTGFTPLPWAVGSTSFLCVKPPTQRTPAQLSGGNVSQCNGQLVLNWNAFHIANPSALGSPWLAGDSAYAQGWFRDPAAPKTTNLSDAYHLVWQP